MIEICLFVVHGILLLLFGAFLSGAFTGIRLTVPENIMRFLSICALSGAFQIIVCILFHEDAVWKLYPLITHLPLLLFLVIVYHKSFVISLVSIFTAYLLCQQVKWFGVLAFSITESVIAEYLVRICTIIIVAYITMKYLASYFAKIYSKDTRSVCIFGIMPMIYYVFDYSTMIYTDLWINNNRVVAEFLPFFFGITYMIFCILYCSENEKKIIAEHKADIIQITAEQQNKEIEAIKRNEHEIRLLRHDMRLFLSSLAVCLEQDKSEEAKEMLASYISRIENTRMEHFCNIDTIDYVLADFAAKCKSNHVDFSHTIDIADFRLDKNLFASILSNSLDNALNAQKDLPEDSRKVILVLKTANHKLLLSVENPFFQRPVFSDGFPVSPKKGHGYGTQSIRYMTERLNGKCQFTVRDDVFVMKVII